MKNQPITLEAIKRLLNETLDQKFTINNQILIAAFDKDFKYLEGRINSVDNKIEDFRAEVNKRFNEVDKRFDQVEDKIQSLDERLIVQSERTRKLEKPIFSSI